MKKKEEITKEREWKKVRVVFSQTVDETIHMLGQDVVFPTLRIDSLCLQISKYPETEEDFYNLENDIAHMEEGWNIYIISITKLKD